MNPSDTKEVKLYEIINRSSGQKSYQPASNAEDACSQAGWLPGDCFILEQKPRRKSAPGQEEKLLVRIPCHICPFQYCECRKLDSDDCPIQPTSPELKEWLKQATAAHLCDFVGQLLTKKDHRLGQKWLPLEEAIHELTPKP